MTPPPMPKACLRHDEGRKTRHELAPPTCVDRSAHSRGANSFGASGGGVCRTLTPTRNAIGLSRPTACGATVADGRLSPWRSVLPPQGEAQRTRHELRLSAAASHWANCLSLSLGKARPSSLAPTRTTRQAWFSIVHGPRPRPVMRTNG